MVNLKISIPNQLEERLNALAVKTGRTKSEYVRVALEEKLEELEDDFLATDSLENIKMGRSRVWTHEEIETGRDLQD